MGDEWEFDATTPVESNRRVFVESLECPSCKHVHHPTGGAGGALGGIMRCWTPVFVDGGPQFRRCRCEWYYDHETRKWDPPWDYPPRGDKEPGGATSLS